MLGNNTKNIGSSNGAADEVGMEESFFPSSDRNDDEINIIRGSCEIPGAQELQEYVSQLSLKSSTIDQIRNILSQKLTPMQLSIFERLQSRIESQGISMLRATTYSKITYYIGATLAHIAIAKQEPVFAENIVSHYQYNLKSNSKELTKFYTEASTAELDTVRMLFKDGIESQLTPSELILAKGFFAPVIILNRESSRGIFSLSADRVHQQDCCRKIIDNKVLKNEAEIIHGFIGYDKSKKIDEHTLKINPKLKELLSLVSSAEDRLQALKLWLKNTQSLSLADLYTVLKAIPLGYAIGDENSSIPGHVKIKETPSDADDDRSNIVSNCIPLYSPYDLQIVSQAIRSCQSSYGKELIPELTKTIELIVDKSLPDCDCFAFFRASIRADIKANFLDKLWKMLDKVVIDNLGSESTN